MRLRALLFVALVLGIASAIAARSSTADDVTSSSSTTTDVGTTTTAPAGPVPDMRLADFRTKRNAARSSLHEKKRRLCRSHEWAHFVHRAAEIRVDHRRENLAMWRRRLAHARTLSSK